MAEGEIVPSWGEVSQIDGKPYYRYDFSSCDSKEAWEHYTDTYEMLRSIGWEIIDPCVEHDCLTGFLSCVNEGNMEDKQTEELLELCARIYQGKDWHRLGVMERELVLRRERSGHLLPRLPADGFVGKAAGPVAQKGFGAAILESLPDIEVPPGHVVFHGNGGLDSEREWAAKFLEVGRTYKAIGGEEHGFVAYIELEGLEGQRWNTSLFHCDRESLPFTRLADRLASNIVGPE